MKDKIAKLDYIKFQNELFKDIIKRVKKKFMKWEEVVVININKRHQNLKYKTFNIKLQRKTDSITKKQHYKG